MNDQSSKYRNSPVILSINGIYRSSHFPSRNLLAFIQWTTNSTWSAMCRSSQFVVVLHFGWQAEGSSSSFFILCVLERISPAARHGRYRLHRWCARSNRTWEQATHQSNRTEKDANDCFFPSGVSERQRSSPENIQCRFDRLKNWIENGWAKTSDGWVSPSSLAYRRKRRCIELNFMWKSPMMK